MGVRGQHRRGSFIHDLQWPLHGILLCLCNNTLMGTQTQCLSEIYTEWVPSRHNLHGSLWHQASFWQQHRRFWCIPQILYPFAGREEPEKRKKRFGYYLYPNDNWNLLNVLSWMIVKGIRSHRLSHTFFFFNHPLQRKTGGSNHNKGYVVYHSDKLVSWIDRQVLRATMPWGFNKRRRRSKLLEELL